MSTPYLSVIVPVYNVENYLAHCLDSILSQTFTDFEVLLIDDGSTDGSRAVCERYAAQDDRIRLFHKENGGLVSARQYGFPFAQGEYVTFVDSDDWIDPAMYQNLCGAAKKRTLTWSAAAAPPSRPKKHRAPRFLRTRHL